MDTLNEGSDGDARQAAAQAVSTAAEQTKHVAVAASDSARDVAQTAKEQASQVVGEVADQGKNLLHDAKGQLSNQARVQTDQVCQAMRSVSNQAMALADGRPDEAGPVGEYTRQAATKMSELAGRLEERGFDGVIRDIEDFARRRPGTFLLGAAVAGFAIGRVFRGAAAANADAGPPNTTKAIPATRGNVYANLALQSPPVELDQTVQAGSLDQTSLIPGR
jgi:hypothetical protein